MDCVNRNNTALHTPVLNSQLLTSQNEILVSFISHNSQGKMVVWLNVCVNILDAFWCDFHTPLLYIYDYFFVFFYLLFVPRIRKERTCQDIIMSQLAADTAHINNTFGSQNLWMMMGMSGVQYSGFYGANFSSISSTHAPLVDNEITGTLSFSHTALHYSVKQNNYNKTNGITCK